MDRLLANQRLDVDDRLLSNNGLVTLVMQGDGNLVLYRTDTGAALWSSVTWQRPVNHSVMQGDGNFVAYAPDGQAYWATGTVGHPGACVVLRDDGNLVVYDSASNPLWTSNTVQSFPPPPPSVFDLVPSENLIRWIRSRKENRIMIETDGDLLQASARIYVGLLSFA